MTRLLLAALILVASTTRAHALGRIYAEPGSEQVPSGNWLYQVCADSAAAGIVPGYDAADFSGKDLLTEMDFARFAVASFDAWQAARGELSDQTSKPWNISNPDWLQSPVYLDLAEKTERLEALSMVLYFRFPDLLSPTSVRIKDMGMGEVPYFNRIVSSKEACDSTASTPNLADPDDPLLPAGHWAYAVYDKLEWDQNLLFSISEVDFTKSYGERYIAEREGHQWASMHFRTDDPVPRGAIAANLLQLLAQRPIDEEHADLLGSLAVEFRPELKRNFDKVVGIKGIRQTMNEVLQRQRDSAQAQAPAGP